MNPVVAILKLKKVVVAHTGDERNPSPFRRQLDLSLSDKLLLSPNRLQLPNSKRRWQDRRQ